MSDTTTPSAAEVMGFTPKHDYIDGNCSWCDANEDVYTDPEYNYPTHCPDNPGGPTPDDMLAWLRGRGYIHTISSYVGGFVVTVSDLDLRQVAQTERTPTLHAALEQAVIAVGRAE